MHRNGHNTCIELNTAHKTSCLLCTVLPTKLQHTAQGLNSISGVCTHIVQIGCDLQQFRSSLTIEGAPPPLQALLDEPCRAQDWVVS